MWIGALLIVVLCGYNIAAAKVPDWLVTKIDTPTTLTTSTRGTLVLSNGLIFREFTLEPDFGTVDFYSLREKSSAIRAINPEAIIALDGREYNVSGLVTDMPRAYLNRTALNESLQSDPYAFHYHSHSTEPPTAQFPYTPKRGAPKTIVWPPKGLRLNVNFVAPKTAPIEHQKIIVTVHYEMYDGVPILSKWISVTGTSPVMVAVYSVEFLSLNQPWSVGGIETDTLTGQKDAEGRNVNWGPEAYNWLYVETDQSHATKVKWGYDPARGPEYGSYQPTVNCTYSLSMLVPLPKEGFESFKVHEMMVGPHSMERLAMAKHRLLRLLAPWTQENPIFVHVIHSDTKSITSILDQMAEVGFELLIYSFGSGFNIESTNDTYIKQVADQVAYAHSKGIEIGGYDLISLSRTSKPEWMAVDVNQTAIGSVCFASDWYDFLSDKFMTFINKTGISNVETDGPYGGYSCHSTNHSHHKGFADSVYWQQKLQANFFTKLGEKGIYINQPDRYFYQGGSRTGIGYNEKQFSLPRWEDLSISRQSVFDDTFRLIPTAGWIFVPLTAYHTPGPEIIFEPMSEHYTEYEWALAQYMGAGVAATYRGYRLYDTNSTKALVKKWVDFYKTYREIITSDIVHVKRPDMQSIDSFMHVNPFIANKGLAMVFNPTLEPISTTLTLPLYYTGLTDLAKVSQEGGAFKTYTLERDYSIEVDIDLGPLRITWFLIQ